MAQLYPFQEQGAAWIADKRHALLADEMGLGKSAQIIRALGDRRALIVAPAIVCRGWVREFEKFAPGKRAAAYVASSRAPIPDHRHVVTSYGIATTRKEELRRLGFDVLALDEAHSVKDPTSMRTRAILAPIANGLHSLASGCGELWLATGTPMPNHPGELWPFLKAAGRVTGRYSEYLDRFCDVRETPFGSKITGAKNVPELRHLLEGVRLRRLKRDVLKELPPLTVGTISVSATEIRADNPVLPYLREHEPAAAETILDAIESKNWRLAAVPHIATVRRYVGLAKIRSVARLVQLELDHCYEKIVLFCLHSEVISSLAKSLADYGVVTLEGGQSGAARDASIVAFQNDPRVRVAVCQIRAAGAGITLTAANRLLIVEPSWSPADNLQAMMRVHRIGQFLPTLVSYVSLDTSSDIQVAAAIARKTATESAIIDHEPPNKLIAI